MYSVFHFYTVFLEQGPSNKLSWSLEYNTSFGKFDLILCKQPNVNKSWSNMIQSLVEVPWICQWKSKTTIDFGVSNYGMFPPDSGLNYQNKKSVTI